VQLAGTPFPSADWTDFVVVVLGWWCESLAMIAEEPTQARDVRFMEGPFLVKLVPIADSRILVSPVDTSAAVAATGTIEVALASLMRTTLKASREILDACGARGWSSRDIEQLSANRDLLARAYGKAALN